MRIPRFRSALESLSPRDRRALTLGALVALPVLLWVLAVRPYFGVLAGIEDRLASEQALLRRERAMLVEAPGYAGMMREASTALRAWEDRLLNAPNPALAEAELTSILEGAARRNRVLLREAAASGRARAEQVPEGLVPIRMSVGGESDFEGVMGFLGALERDPIVLRIVGLSLNRVSGNAEADSFGGDGPPPQLAALSFTVIVEGYTKTDAQETG